MFSFLFSKLLLFIFKLLHEQQFHLFMVPSFAGTLNKGAEPKVNLVSRSHSKFWFGWITIIQIEQNDMAGLAANYISGLLFCTCAMNSFMLNYYKMDG